MIQRIAIVGVGLIGGSLAVVWKKKRPSLHLIGQDRPAVLDEALIAGVIDEAAPTLRAAVQAADLVVLATPVGAMPALLDDLAPLLRPGTRITDVGSVKTPVVQHAEKVLPEENPFIGGHPMAGSEHSGVGYADAFLFENATYVLCPPSDLDTDAFTDTQADVIDLVGLTGANVMVMDAEHHDRIAATVSHLPQLVAVSLMNLAAESNRNDPAFLRLAAGGFRDMTRIAGSSFDVWDDILLANREPLAGAISRLIDVLTDQKDRLSSGQTAPFAEEFRRARRARRSIPKDMKGFLSPLADIYVYAQDRPGFLYHLTHIVYEAGLNIKDIELLKIREGTGGAFRLGFAHEADANQAVDTLNSHGYTAYRL